MKEWAPSAVLAVQTTRPSTQSVFPGADQLSAQAGNTA